MKTKKKVMSRKVTRVPASPKFCGHRKKVYQHVPVKEKEATDLITSSAKKQRIVRFSNRLCCKETGHTSFIEDGNADRVLSEEKDHDLRVAFSTVAGESIDHQDFPQRNVQCVLETIFSPGFHMSADNGCSIPHRVDFIKYFKSDNQTMDHPNGVKKDDTSNSVVPLDGCDSLAKEQHIQFSRDLSVAGNTMFPGDVVDTSNTGPLEEYEGHANCTQRCLMNDADGVCSCEGELVERNISASERPYLYLAIQSSKLECTDEPSQVSVSPYVEDDCDDDEIDDFDPYLFIKNLPELSVVVPTLRPMLLPKQTRRCPRITLVLDLDETLVHSTLEYCEDADFTFPVNFNDREHTVYVRCRPHLRDFMDRIVSMFEIIVFTASQSIYAEQLLNVLDPKRKVFRHRVYRESCVVVDGNYLKDLTVLGRDLAQVAIIDNSPQAFGFQVDNGIPIESWFDDRCDSALPSLLPFLESLVGVEDVRPLIAQKFNLRQKIAAAVDPLTTLGKGDPFSRNC
ncbi:CTD small phosphatase-like protein isoform X2 [Amborella trichopoda]|uniref:CTD small phosphatase-like protein isoform X2 n=1 Tax=Amborella trichopoda TaxID=13333 RepID=UPI0005D3B394|nr:CTD small phosphatase-like protein isoform X2 [Amborella trichopoda]|eukprot:XP_011624893.1 CTD small phosphatase-like protein isoform X2 [Amborella trichopoda]